MTTQQKIHPLTGSTWLSAAIYDYPSRTLTLIKQDGGALIHAKVEPRKLAHLVRSKSAGAAYVKHIKGQCPHVKTVKPRPTRRKAEPADSLEALLKASIRQAGGVA